MRAVTFIILALIFAFSVFSQDEPVFKVDLSKNRVRVGEVFVYSISVEIEFKDIPKIKPPQFEDFAVISQNTSRHISYGRDKGVLKLKLEYVLLAIKEGEFKLPQALLEYKDNTLQSPSKEIQVSGTTPEFKQKKEQERKENIRDYLEGAVSI